MEKFKRNQDIDGNESSKRVLGFRLANIGIAMGVIYFVLGISFAIIGKELNYEFPAEIFWGFLGSGCGSIGITLFERFGKNR